MHMRIAFTAVALLLSTAALAHPPVSVVIDSRGNVYYSDLSQVWRVAPNGAKSVAVRGVHTHELYLDAQDNLFGEHLWYEGERIDRWGHYVWKRDAAGRVSLVKPRTEGFLTDYSFTRDRAGNMYWPVREKGEIRKRAPNGAITRVVGELKQMRWLHVAPSGTLYVVDGGDLVRVREGRSTRLARSLMKTSLLRPHVSFQHSVMGIWTDPAENVYLADYANGRVLRVTQSGRIATLAESTQPWSPTGGAFAPNGDLLLLEASITNAVRVRRIAAAQLRRR
jgi:DNA-binding beta-propeller fold protein YncE